MTEKFTNAKPQDLDSLIKVCLTDGVISDKEREFLLRKAEQLGIDLDEMDIYIDAQEQKEKELRKTDAVKSSRKGLVCPHCGESIPDITDRCPHCGCYMTAAASDELEILLNKLENSLANFKESGYESDKSKTERYLHKLKLYYATNPKVQQQLEKYEEEIKNKVKAEKAPMRRVHIIGVCSFAFIIIFIVFGMIAFFIHGDEKRAPQEKVEQEKTEELWGSDSDRVELESDEKQRQKTVEQEIDELETSEDWDSDIQTKAKKVTEHLANGDVDRAALVLEMCGYSRLGDRYNYGDLEDVSALYTTLVTKVAHAYVENGQKKKAQDFVVNCSNKYSFGRKGLSDLFLELGSDGNYQFK